MREDRWLRDRKETVGVLHHALQRARSNLAVAFASEKRATPPTRWRFYRETDDRMRRYLKELRKLGSEHLEMNQIWQDALEALRGLPRTSSQNSARQGAAYQLCRRLSEVLRPLEESHTFRPDAGLPKDPGSEQNLRS